jgi:hypothetical protein
MKSKSKLNKLIAVRFTEQELTRLEAAAEEQGIGPSTLTRMIVNQALKPTGPRPRKLTSDEFRDVMLSTLARLGKDRVDSFFKDVSVGSPDEPTLLMWAGQTDKWEEFTARFLRSLLASLGIEVSPADEKKAVEADTPPAFPLQEQQGVRTAT